MAGSLGKAAREPSQSGVAAVGQTGYVYRRRRTRVVWVGNVGIGGDNPIRVQSMTTTRTQDIDATVAQVVRLVQVGCEIARITAPTAEDAACLRVIRDRLRAQGVGVPLVADIHFNPRAALEAARWVEKVRINPGNYADSRTFARHEYSDGEYARELARIEERLLPLIEVCKARGVAMRIGTNHGSLSDRIMSRFGDTPDGMVESALEFVRICRKHGYDELVLSMKASNPRVMVQAYRLLAARMDAEGMDYPFHLGVTEAGSGIEARVKSAAGIGTLLDDGIGDTIRVSLAEEPEAEVPVAQKLAALYSGADLADRIGCARMSVGLPTEARDPFVYRRRESRVVRIGPVAVGVRAADGTIQNNAPVVSVALGATANWPERAAALFASGAGPRAWPDLLEVELDAPDLVGGMGERAASRLRELRRILETLGARPGIVGVWRLADLETHASTSDGSLSLDSASLRFLDALKLVAEPGAEPGTLLGESTLAVARVAATSARAAKLPLVLSVEAAEKVEAEERGQSIEPIEAAVELVLALAEGTSSVGASDLVLGVRLVGASRQIRAVRLLAARLAERGWDYPIALGALADEDSVVPLPALPAKADGNGEASDAPSTMLAGLPLGICIALGSPILDGLGDLVRIDPGAGELSDVVGARLAFDCLQAVGARSFKAELIACPGCGRTLFDLQSTTERIKSRTGHLVGVKIAVMGCVVNGPGELADADFGYMGGAPGRVSLFVGRECVARNLPESEVDDRLVDLIRVHGRWIEPE